MMPDVCMVCMVQNRCLPPLVLVLLLRHAPIFQFDTNKDGLITKAELLKGLKKVKWQGGEISEGGSVNRYRGVVR